MPRRPCLLFSPPSLRGNQFANSVDGDSLVPLRIEMTDEARLIDRGPRWSRMEPDGAMSLSMPSMHHRDPPAAMEGV